MEDSGHTAAAVRVDGNPAALASRHRHRTRSVAATSCWAWGRRAYEWRAEYDAGLLRNALPGPVDAHRDNASPVGVREMAGNVWELTATVLDDSDEAVVCGGSYDSPYRAVQASAKDVCPRNIASGAVGFRCVSDLS